MEQGKSQIFSKLTENLKKNQILIGLAVFVIYLGFSLPAVIDYYFHANSVYIGWTRYSEKDVAKELPEVFRKLKTDQINTLTYAFEEFVTRKLIEMEAKAQNKKSEEVLSDGKSYTPTDLEIEKVYNQYKSQLNGKSLESVKGEIINALKMRHDNDAKNGVIAGIKEKYKDKVKINIQPLPEERLTVEEKNNPSIGPKDAKVTIVEFSDFECPYCQRSQPVNKQLREMYKDKIRWVFRDYPLPFHQNAKFAHLAVNCAIPQGKYWEYFNILFENTGNLTKENVKFLAKKAGLDSGQFEECLKNSASLEKEIEQDIADGQKLGVDGTPAFFINGIMVAGAQPLQAFTKIIDKELKN
ncbi:MAG: DsbA family protein [Leptospiraceae bacterium]|nr:DsbA family protein [Leptospiraceae bacterium]MCK6380581.1 DsbA family protein [Leptospiraceae bacterium]NUM40338.1 DsbA family protein [Leptospiraceae bacterium]